MRLSKEQINEIRRLSAEGKTQMEIAEIIRVSQNAVCYWLKADDERKEIVKKAVESFRKKPIEVRRKLYKKRLEYLKAYRRKRYQEDESFREKEKARTKSNWKKKHEKKQA